MKNDALVRKCDFEDVGMAGKCAAESDAILAADAKCAAESASVTERKPHKKCSVENGTSLPCFTVGAIGLGPTTDCTNPYLLDRFSKILNQKTRV
jgi:hypothetical protein